ncbi:MAG: hypothetical protein QOE80_1785 [Actinomycetota bacterium]|nr:hypothetical protein [Actinomycetota bacterium]
MTVKFPGVTEIRLLFCDTVDATTALVGDATLLERFDGPSALAGFSVRGLAGHLLRAVTSAEGYLDNPEPDTGPEPLSAAEYYGAVVAASTDVDDDFNRAIRQRGVEAASGRPEEFPAAWAGAAARIRARLAAEPAGRLVRVYGDLVLTLDEYLVTRLIEVVVHADDLAVSLGVAPPPLPAATGVAVATLVEAARRRHGDAAVLRALTRRERDDVAALRVL